MSDKKKVIIVCGGVSNEREISLKTGRQIFSFLNPEKYDIQLLEISANGKWLLRNNQELLGMGSEDESSESISLTNMGDCPQVAFIAMHGKYGEDGRIQAMLDFHNIPYTGSGVLASALGMNKLKTLDIVSSNGVLVPQKLIVTKNYSLTDLRELVKNKLGYPCFIKPNESGSSIGVCRVNNEIELQSALEKSFQEDELVLIEEAIIGREFSCGVLGNQYDESLALPPAEIVVKDSDFFDYQTKYFSSTVEEICPAPIDQERTEQIKELAKKIHTIIGCDGLTRSDFILSDKDGKFYFLEINTIPGQTEASICPKEAKAMGWSFSDLLDKQIELAIKKFKL